MSTVFTSLKQLQRYLEVQIEDTLLNDVKEKVIDNAINKAIENVYGAYGSNSTGQPNVYNPKYAPNRRRYNGGGLIDRKNFEGIISTTGTLEIRNITKPEAAPGADWEWNNPVYNLSELIEYGHGGGGGYYAFGKGADTFGDFRPPRPFMIPTQDEFARGSTLKNIIKQGLKRHGLTVE